MCIYNIYKKIGLPLRVYTAWTMIPELPLMKRTVKLWHWLEKSVAVKLWHWLERSVVEFAVDHK